MIELTKSQKKKVRALIEVGLTRDYVDGIKRIKEISTAFIEGKSDPKEHYLKLYSALREKDQEIGKRYDDLRGSNYFTTLIMLLVGGVISIEEIQDLDDELKAKIMFFVNNA